MIFDFTGIVKFYRMKSSKTGISENLDMPIFASPQELRVAPRYRMPEVPVAPRLAYQIVHDEVMLDGNPRLNMATFVTSWMDEYAGRLMNENIGKNLADRSEYPQTAEIERRCVNIIAALWNTPEQPYCTGTSTVGSSEACILGGLAALLTWRRRRRAGGRTASGRENFVVSSAYQVVWEKFALLWDLEMRTVPITESRLTLDPERAVELCDENTFMVVAIEGASYTGLNDDVADLNERLGKLNMKTGWGIGIHVDAAAAGFVLPFTDPQRKWDFRLRWVHSISASGHKYGLVYPSIGWIVWRDRQYLPEELSRHTDLLGQDSTTTGLNFSRPAAQVIVQYYQFLRLGYAGYRDIQLGCLQVSDYLRKEMALLGFKLLSDRQDNPVFCVTLPRSVARKWTLYDLSERMRAQGWMLPVYPLPPDLEEHVVMRIIVRQGMGLDLANFLVDDLKLCIERLDRSASATDSYIALNSMRSIDSGIFDHNR